MKAINNNIVTLDSNVEKQNVFSMYFMHPIKVELIDANTCTHALTVISLRCDFQYFTI